MDDLRHCGFRFVLLSLIPMAGSVGAGEGEAGLPPAAIGPLDYWKDVHPILTELCWSCHGGGNRKGGLGIDSKDGFLAGGTSGPAASPGNGAGSLIIRRVTSADDEERMPRKGRRLMPGEVAILRAWIDQGLPWAAAPPAGGAKGPSYERRTREADVGPRRPPVPEPSGGLSPDAGPIDRFLAPYFASKGFQPPGPVDDRTFARRVWIDAIGLLPTAEQFDGFAADGSPGKRAALVRSLLARRREYAEHWLSFWNDLLRNDYQGTGYIDGGRRQITGWLYRALARNLPYDRMVAGLVSPDGESEGFIGGIVWRGVVNASQSPALQAAQGTAQVFLGINLKCASCHDSFVSDWKLKEAYGLASVFAAEPLEIVRCDALTGERAVPGFLFPQLGAIEAGRPRPERLKRLAEIITSRENGRLARTIVNRLWARFLGRGLVEPIDEMDGMAWHPDLLDFLASDLQDHGYDLKRTMEMILASRAYAMPSVPRDEASKEEYLFRGPEVRRLSGEEFLDALGSLADAGAAYPEAPVDFTCTAGDGNGPRKPALGTAPSWIWGPDPAVGAAAGGPVHLRKVFRVPFQIEAAVLVAAGGEFTVFIGGKPAAQGKGRPVLADLRPFLQKGENTVAVEAAGAAAGLPPGFLLQIRARGEGRVADLATDRSWKWSASVPTGWEQPGFPAQDWEPVTEAGPLDGTRPEARGEIEALLAVGMDAGKYRAALVPSGPLLTSLGRPNREQIVTRRQSVATTLEALELSNGPSMAGLVARSTRNLLAAGPATGRKFVESLYRKALARDPTAGELEAAMALACGREKPDPEDPVRPEGAEDLLWCLLLHPEFQLIF